jgi:hypothetical protein
MNARLRFIQSDFNGQLPRYFQENTSDSGRNTHIIPEGMNDRNIQDPSSLYNGHCDVVVYLSNEYHRNCTRFMVGSSNPGIYKSFFVSLSAVNWNFYCYNKTW